MKVIKKSYIIFLARISRMMRTKQIHITIMSPPVAAIISTIRGIARGVRIIAANRAKLMNK